jgi:hypothetical protein
MDITSPISLKKPSKISIPPLPSLSNLLLPSPSTFLLLSPPNNLFSLYLPTCSLCPIKSTFKKISSMRCLLSSKVEVVGDGGVFEYSSEEGWVETEGVTVQGMQVKWGDAQVELHSYGNEVLQSHISEDKVVVAMEAAVVVISLDTKEVRKVGRKDMGFVFGAVWMKDTHDKDVLYISRNDGFLSFWELDKPTETFK